MKHILLAVIALLGAALLLLPWMPPTWAGSLIFLSLGAVPFMLLQLVIAGILYAKKEHLWRWIYIGLCAANIPLMCHYCPSQSEPKEASGCSLTLVSWNVTNFHISADTLQAAAAYLRSLQPDIICLQEVPHNNLLRWDSIRAAFPEHRYSYKNRRDDEVLNLGVLSKYPLSEVRTWYFAHSYNKMADLRVSTPQGTFRLWNVHLQTTGSPDRFADNARQRNRQASLLRQQTESDSLPALICGDFNDTPSSYAYRLLKQGRSDAYRERGQQFTGSYQPMGKWVRIDYLLCPDRLRVLRYDLLPNTWSDHKIQLATIEL
ncbi:MAG: endonuclease/exonuclease/phosphatase family protein [Bacteroides sp.]|nr:endonuclease/exonuclease/phosphatase family protein [Bacteroides sp.]